jgi:hypothetical protein
MCDEDVTVPAEERGMKDSSRVLRKLGNESGDTSNGIGSTWLDVRDGEWAVTGGVERGGRCGVGKAHPATAGLEEDEAEEKREREYGEGHKKGATQGGSGEQIVIPMIKWALLGKAQGWIEGAWWY